MYCPKCKKEYDNDNVFCLECGTKLIKKIELDKVNQEIEQVTEEAEQADSDTSAKNDKKKIVKIIVIALVVALVIELIVMGVIVAKNKKNKNASKQNEVTTEQEEDKEQAEEEQAAEEEPQKRGIEDPEGYIIPSSADTLLVDSNLQGLSAQELTYGRNEIYARHGYIFNSPELNEYFATKTWYQANAGYDGTLSDVEGQNAEFIKNYQTVNNLEYVPRPQITADGEYSIYPPNVGNIYIKDGYLYIETVDMIYDSWNEPGIGTIVAKYDSETTAFETGGIGGPYESCTFDELCRLIQEDKTYYYDSINSGGDYVSPPGVYIYISNGSISLIRIAYS